MQKTPTPKRMIYYNKLGLKKQLSIYSVVVFSFIKMMEDKGIEFDYTNKQIGTVLGFDKGRVWQAVKELKMKGLVSSMTKIEESGNQVRVLMVSEVEK